MTTQETIAEVRRMSETIGRLRPPSTPTDSIFRTAAPALADAVEKRDEVIHALAESIAIHFKNKPLVLRAISACGAKLIDGKWRIAE